MKKNLAGLLAMATMFDEGMLNEQAYYKGDTSTRKAVANLSDSQRKTKAKNRKKNKKASKQRRK